MSEQLPDGPGGDHPIAAGLGALVGVAVVVGLILGLVVLGGARVLGVGGSSDADTTSGQASVYIPTPEKTPPGTAPQVTLAPDPAASSGSDKPSDKPSSSKSPRKQISLSASTTSAGPMEPFDLTGVYPGGEGAIVTVQRFQDGSWQDFPATGSVSGETFQLPVQTSQPGANKFRVVDSDTGLKSNEVRVTIG